MEQQLKELIVNNLFLDIDPSEIDNTTPLSDYGVDSFLLLEVIVGIEEMFNVKFEQTDINAETLESVASMTAAIKAKMN